MIDTLPMQMVVLCNYICKVMLMIAELKNIQDIRAASRLMVRELGFMNQNLAATDYPPSAVHAMLEVEAHGSMAAAQLVQILGLEKSSVSRMLANGGRDGVWGSRAIGDAATTGTKADVSCPATTGTETVNGSRQLPPPHTTLTVWLHNNAPPVPLPENIFSWPTPLMSVKNPISNRTIVPVIPAVNDCHSL